jgi:hypothetical protein
MADLSVLLTLFLNIFLQTAQPAKNSLKPELQINYSLSHPDKIYFLPYSLSEISGITETDATSVACIQDNNGILFKYDLKKEQITLQDYFFEKGDYEGIARVDNTIYVLRSDGMLFEITNYESSTFKVQSYSTGIPARDNEGLCYDHKTNRILIAPKSPPGEKSGNRDNRFIYSFDLKSKKLIEKPAIVIEMSDVKKFASENKIRVPAIKGKKGRENEPFIEFRPSAIGIQPFTGRLFVISGVEQLLFIFNMNGTLEYMEKLDPGLFPQPEGITFLKNGDMLISNEGHKQMPSIVRLNFHIR